uniref:Low-density lipoprotein receptor-related protein 4 n=1 Tax=Magallana gigas TaxID=29159 RepID=K1QI54_MAGGI
MGVWNNASFITTLGIPDSNLVQFNNFRFNLSPVQTRITSIAAGPERSLYFSAERGIYEISNYSIWNNESFTISPVYRGKSNSVGQIAVDVLSNNIYWCDGLLNWIAMKPLSVTNATTSLTYRVLIDRDLHQPEGLALDPHDGLMFFSENYPRCRIERASMSGNNRTVLLYSGLIRVMSLSLDTEDKRVFWADYERHTVETCGYDGSDRRVLRRMNGVPITGLQFYENVVHGVSPARRTVVGIDANTGDVVYDSVIPMGDPYAVTVFDAAVNTSIIDPCSLIQCQQICVNTPFGPTCLCGEGFLLEADGLSCKVRTWFHDKGLIINNATMFYMLDTRFINGQGGRVPYMVTSSIISTFTVNAHSRLIYFADAKTNSLYELNLFTQRYRLVTSTAPAAGTCQILNGGCDDICIPTGEGRECKCDAGSQLQADSTTCSTNVKPDDFLVVTDFSHDRILQIDMITGEMSRLPLTVKKCTGLSLGQASRELLYSDQALKTIQSFSLLTRNTTVLYTTGFYFAERMTVGASTGHLYFTALSTLSNSSYIGVIHRTLRVHRTLIPNLQTPRAIALYPSKGLMYFRVLFWTEIGPFPGIGRAHMDGTSREYIVSRDILVPNGLAIDYEANRIYWTDGEKNQIESSDIDGGNRQVLTSDPGALMMDIVVNGQLLFYTAWNRQRFKEDNFVKSIYVLKIVNKACSNGEGQCSTFCFPTPDGGICGCQDSVSLLPNNKTCVGAPRCTSDLTGLDLLDCEPSAGLSCRFQCQPGLTLTLNTTLTCTPGGQWNVIHCSGVPSFHAAATVFTNDVQSGIFEKYSLYIYIGGGCALLMVLVPVSLLLRRFVCRRKTKEPPRLHYESSVTSESNPYSAFMNRGYENSCMDRPKSGEYNTIAEMMMYEDMKAPGGGTTDPQNPYLKPCDNRDIDTYFIPCTEHTESPYLKAI